MGVTLGLMVLRVYFQDIEFIVNTRLYSIMILGFHSTR